MEKMDLGQVVNGITLVKQCSIKADGESVEKKAINLKVSFDGVTLQDVFMKALAGAVIQWQNGPGRKNFDNWTDNQTVEVSFKAPGAQPQLSLMDKLKLDAKAAGVDVTDAEALMEFVREQLEG